MKNKLMIIILIMLSVVSGCKSSLKADTLTTIDLSQRERDLITLVAPNTENNIFEFNFQDLSEVQILLQVYNNGELIQENILSSYHDNKDIDVSSGKICFCTDSDNNIKCSVASGDYLSTYSLDSEEIAIPNDGRSSLSTFLHDEKISIEPNNEITIFFKAFVSDSQDGLHGITLLNYEQEDLKEYEYCYVIKCRFN